jgi:uncharacterized protein HemX
VAEPTGYISNAPRSVQNGGAVLSRGTRRAISQTDNIISRIGNRTVECPVELLTELQREREQATSDRDWLLAEAEAIKDNATNYILQMESSG